MPRLQHYTSWPAQLQTEALCHIIPFVACTLLLVCWGTVAAIAADSTKTIVAVRTLISPVIDGALNDPVWREAEPIMSFRQLEPAEGAEASESTAVRIVYDNDALYIGVLCYDTHPERIVQQMTRRDRTTESDRFTVMIDSYFDRKTAYVFSANVSGVQSDGVLSQEGVVYDLSWDAVWRVETRLVKGGWSAEFVIPFHALRFSADRGEYIWGINFRRYISRKKETDDWVVVPHNEASQIPHWGTLNGIRTITQPMHIDLQPYLSGSGAYTTALPGQPRTEDYSGIGGIDAKLGLASNFTLDMTVNPDFGQVEVDQSILNLTVFETLYPEKRPFFTEGAHMFTFGSTVDNTTLGLFFSRRVGKQPGGSAYIVAPAGGRVTENPNVTTIYGAVKVTGRTSEGLSVAALSAATAPEYAELRDAAGSGSRLRTEPKGLYNVVRLKQEFEGGSWLGTEATLTARGDSLPALTGGIDWNFRLGEGTHSLDGYLAGARSSRAPGARDGGAGKLFLARISAEHWYYNVSFDFATRYFDPNDIGYFARPHDYGGYTQIMYWQTSQQKPFRRYAISFVPEFRWNWDGQVTRAQVEASATGFFTTFWDLSLIYLHKFSAYDDAESGILGLYRRPQAHQLRGLLMSDERKAVSGSLDVGLEWDGLRKNAWTGSLGLTLRPLSWLELTPNLLYQVVRREESAVFANGEVISLPGARGFNTLFADRNVRQMNVELRGTLTFTRTFSLQFFFQTLLAKGEYSGYRALTGEHSFTDLAIANGTYDFNQTFLHANVLLRWEYFPGSTVYLVWTQGRGDDSGADPAGLGERFREIFALPHDDAILLKISYWLGL
jgi:hypothetical protein